MIVKNIFLLFRNKILFKNPNIKKIKNNMFLKQVL